MSTETVTKPIWTRCKGPKGEGNGCRQRVFNNPIDIELHRQHCPADLERTVKLLTDRVDKLEKAEPEQIDLDDVGDEWPTGDEAATPVAAAAHAGVVDYFNLPSAQPVAAAPDDDDDIDDDL